jgi:hypothetical protein
MPSDSSVSAAWCCEIRAFVTAKGGLITFRGGNPTFIGTVSSIPTGETDAVLYPGGGLEGYIGPIGLRFDVGDQIYFASSNAGNAHHNLKITFGPHFRFREEICEQQQRQLTRAAFTSELVPTAHGRRTGARAAYGRVKSGWSA